MKDLRNANAIVTGASRGLGAHIARALASSGVNVAVAARSAQQLEAVRAELVSLGVKAIGIRADVTVAAERQELVDRAAAELGPIDILVNNAGAELASRYTDLDPAQIEAMVNLNLTAPLLLIRAVLPGMLDRGKGHIVNLSSGAGKVVEPFERRLFGDQVRSDRRHPCAAGGVSRFARRLLRDLPRLRAPGRHVRALRGTGPEGPLARRDDDAPEGRQRGAQGDPGGPRRDHREQPAGATRSGAPGGGSPGDTPAAEADRPHLDGGAGSRDETDRCRQVIMPDPAWLEPEHRAAVALAGARRHDMRSACDSERPTTVTHGQSWSLDGCGHESALSAFALVRATRNWSKTGGQGQDRTVDLPLQAGRRLVSRPPVAYRAAPISHPLPGFLAGAPAPDPGPRELRPLCYHPARAQRAALRGPA